MTWRRSYLAWGVALLIAVVATLSLSQYAVVLRVESDSMAPTIAVGDLVVSTRLQSEAIERGGIYVFNDPGGWSDTVAQHTGRASVAPIFIKRVIGLPGERVACCDADGRITVDGAPLDEDYLESDARLASILAFDVLVPDDELFMLGDARENSIDSRYLGTVPIGSLVARERFTLSLP